MALWASCYPLITISLDSAPHLTFAVMRAVIAGSLLLGVALMLRRTFPVDLESWGWIGLAGLAMTGLGYYGNVPRRRIRLARIGDGYCQ